MDFLKVNSGTKPDSYSLPSMEDCVDRVGSAKFVTKLNLLKGYWQAPLTTRIADISVGPDFAHPFKLEVDASANEAGAWVLTMKVKVTWLANLGIHVPQCLVYCYEVKKIHKNSWII